MTGSIHNKKQHPEEGTHMASKLGLVRSSTVVRKPVRSSAAAEALQASLRRLGADEKTVALVPVASPSR